MQTNFVTAWLPNLPAVALVVIRKEDITNPVFSNHCQSCRFKHKNA